MAKSYDAVLSGIVPEPAYFIRLKPRKLTVMEILKGLKEQPTLGRVFFFSTKACTALLDEKTEKAIGRKLSASEKVCGREIIFSCNTQTTTLLDKQLKQRRFSEWTGDYLPPMEYARMGICPQCAKRLFAGVELQQFSVEEIKNAES